MGVRVPWGNPKREACLWMSTLPRSSCLLHVLTSETLVEHINQVSSPGCAEHVAPWSSTEVVVCTEDVCLVLDRLSSTANAVRS